VAIILGKSEREVPTVREIENWHGLSRAERNVLRDLRKHMKTGRADHRGLTIQGCNREQSARVETVHDRIGIEPNP